jgi:hypothetical protein
MKKWRRLFRLGDAQSLLIIISSGILAAYALLRLEPAGMLSMIVYLYAAFGLVIFVVKLRDWLTRLNRSLRHRHPGYNQFWETRIAALNRKSRGTKTIYITLRALTIACGVAMLLTGEYLNFLLSMLTLALFTLPDIVRHRFGIRLPSTLESIIYCFIFSAEILGEINNFYGRIPGWDTILHTINGFLCAAIGFSLVDMLNRNSKRIQLSPAYLAFTAFCFSMTVGVIWEFVEFFADQLFLVDMQKDTLVPTVKSVLLNPEGANVPVILHDIRKTIIEYGGNEQFVVHGGYLDMGIVDTMKDLFVNFIGALVFSTFGYFYVKQRDEDKHSFAERFIPIIEKRGDA